MCVLSFQYVIQFLIELYYFIYSSLHHYQVLLVLNLLPCKFLQMIFNNT